MGKAARQKAERRRKNSDRGFQPATTMLEASPDFTSVPGVLNESSVSTWMGGMDQTSPDPIEDDDGPYATSSWALLDKHFMHGGLRTPIGIALAATIVLCVGLVAWLFIQDNGAGRLETDAGIRHFFTKAGLASALLVSGSLLLIGLGVLAAFVRRRFPNLGRD